MGGPLKLKFANHFIIYQKRPLKGRLGLAGYTHSSGTGELRYQSFTARSLVMKTSFFIFIFKRKTKSDKLQSPCRKMSSPCGLGTSNLASSVSSLNRDSLEHSPSHSLPDSGFSPTGSSQSSLSNSIDFSPTLKNEHSSFSTDVALGLEVDSKPYLSHESGKYFGVKSKVDGQRVGNWTGPRRPSSFQP